MSLEITLVSPNVYMSCVVSVPAMIPLHYRTTSISLNILASLAQKHNNFEKLAKLTLFQVGGTLNIKT